MPRMEKGSQLVSSRWLFWRPHEDS